MQAALKLASAVLALVIPVASATAQQAPYPNRPIAWVLAGGYTKDVSKVVGVHLGTFDAAAAVHG